MARRRVVVCGTNYGQSYVQSLRRAPGSFELAGLLGRGSERSRRLAARLEVPLYRRADDLPDDIQFACAAVGGEAGAVVLRLLERGIHVLCEHPYPADFVACALEAAGASGSLFHVNGHWAGLPASRAFIEHCGTRFGSARPCYLELTVADRFLYAAIDILRQALQRLEPVEIRLVPRGGRFLLLHGALSGVSATLSIQSSRRLDGSCVEEGSSEYLTCYRVAIGFPDGTLSLLSPCGPVVWSVNENTLTDRDRPLWSTPHGSRETAASIAEQRIAANLRAIEALAGHAEGGEAPATQGPEHLLEVSRVWETIGRSLPEPRARAPGS